MGEHVELIADTANGKFLQSGKVGGNSFNCKNGESCSIGDMGGRSLLVKMI